MSKLIKLSDVVVMNYYKRVHEGQAQQKLIQREAKPLGIDVKISFDDGSLPQGTLSNVCQALAMPLDTVNDWRLVVHDDLLVPTNSLAKLNYILGFMPTDCLVSAYCPSNNGYDAAFEAGRHVLSTATNIWAQALLWPEALIPEFLRFVATRVKPDYRYDDRAISAFLQVAGLKCNCIIPSLFQHLGSYRSTLGFPGKVNKRYRYSEHYEPNFNPFVVNWEWEIANPIKNETTVRLKDILI